MLHHSLDRGTTFIAARLLVPKSDGVAIAGSRVAEFAVTDRGVDRLRAHGCYAEGDYVPATLLDELLKHREASQRTTVHPASGTHGRATTSRPRLFPEPQPPCWMLPRRRETLGL